MEDNCFCILYGYCVAIVLISLNVFLIIILGVFSVFSRAFMEGMWKDILASIGMTMIGSTFHLLLVRLLISG